jgi:ABC-type sugar transport system ATPase subunit
VGDAAFQQKCFDEFTRLKAAGRTIVFVTHDMGAVQRFCDRAMLLERGRMVDIGDPASVAQHYNALNFRRVRQEAIQHGGPEHFKRDPVAELLNARFESLDGEKIVSMSQGDFCYVRMDVHFHQPAQDPLFAIVLRNDLGHIAFSAQSHLRYGFTGHFEAGETVRVRVKFENWLGPGRYRLTASVNDSATTDSYDTREDISAIFVNSSTWGGGVVDLPHEFQIERT